MPDVDRQLPLVALIGRPNVGKSTLFNRLVGERSAVVEPQAGTTRDRIYGELEWRGRAFAVVDTAGIAWHDPAPVAEAAVAQARAASDEADLVLVVTDVLTGVTDLDGIVAREVLKRERPHLLVVNKADHMDLRLDTGEFYALGLGEPMAISAMHGTATGDLLDAVAERLPAVAYAGESDALPRLAIVGRPNVGKSSLLNALLGEPRALVHEMPGTTRDSVDTVLEWEGQSIRLIDTAGIRRRGHIDTGVEYHSVLRAVRSIQRCDVGIWSSTPTRGPPLKTRTWPASSSRLEKASSCSRTSGTCSLTWSVVERSTATSSGYCTSYPRRRFCTPPPLPDAACRRPSTQGSGCMRCDRRAWRRAR